MDPPIPGRPDRHLRFWLPVAAVVVIVVVAAILITVMLVRDQAGIPGATTAPAATATGPETAEPTATGSAGPTDRPTGEPTEPVGDASSLDPPGNHLPESGISAIPLTEWLEDGDYLGHLMAIDVTARTVTFDVEILYTGQAAIDYLTANDPGAQNPPPNDYIVVNNAVRARTLALSSDVRVWDWCFDGDDPGFSERSVAEWAAAPWGGETSCDAGASLSRNGETYWFDVRDGVVVQVVGQYLP